MNAIDLKNWGMMRVVRLITGVSIVWSAFTDHQPMLGLLGGFLLFQVITNTGCGAGGCGIPSSRQATGKQPADIEYEEVH